MRGLLIILFVLGTGLQAFSQQSGKTKKAQPAAAMSKVTNNNPKALFDPTPFGFSHATSVEGNGKYVFISGQSGGEGLSHHLSADFRTQVQSALKNLETVLESYGLHVGNVLKITILIVNHDEAKLSIWSEEMQKTWKNKGFPASTLIPVPRLALDGMQIEVDAIAFKGE